MYKGVRELLTEYKSICEGHVNDHELRIANDERKKYWQDKVKEIQALLDEPETFRSAREIFKKYLPENTKAEDECPTHEGIIQKCKNNHQYIANSHEYPCPRCQLIDVYGALSDIRTLVTSCVSPNITGEYLQTCKAILKRSLDVEYVRPSWFQHSWEQEIYEQKNLTDSQEPDCPTCGGTKIQNCPDTFDTPNPCPYCQPKCPTCGGTEETMKTFTDDLSGGKYGDKIPCPRCQPAEPDNVEFIERIKEKWRDVPEGKDSRLWIALTDLIMALDRLEEAVKEGEYQRQRAFDKNMQLQAETKRADETEARGKALINVIQRENRRQAEQIRRLKDWAEHKDNCGLFTMEIEEKKCTCGLEQALKEAE